MQELVETHPSLLISTPGRYDISMSSSLLTRSRLLDIAETNILNLANVSYFVLDEADKLLQFGLAEQVPG